MKTSEISLSNSYANPRPRVKVLTIMLHEKRENGVRVLCLDFSYHGGLANIAK